MLNALCSNWINWLDSFSDSLSFENSSSVKPSSSICLVEKFSGLQQGSWKRGWPITSPNNYVHSAQAATVEFLRHFGYKHHLRKLRQELQASQNRILQAVGKNFPHGPARPGPQGRIFYGLKCRSR
jgi:hypothetical protein